jgi:hypothetical protein
MTAWASLALMASLVAPAQQTFRPDGDGFIRNWLVLAPLGIDGESGAAEIDREFFAGELALRPKANDTARVGTSYYTWQPHETLDYFIDFRESFGAALSDYVAAYAIAYVTSPEEMNVTLAMGSNDQGKVWLNGKEVVKNIIGRGLERDADRADVTLLKGRNVLLFKVINETNSWQGCIRFLRGATPVRDLTISLSPE